MADKLTLLPENAPFLKLRVDALNPDTASGDNIKSLSEDLHTTRRVNKAVGLAANQVGVSVRMFVMGKDGVELTCINPEVLSTNETVDDAVEGCLSFPGLQLKVKRPTEIRVRYLDENLRLREHDLGGVLARCFQHELDHLDGITFDTKVSKLVLVMAKNKRQKKNRFRG